MAAKNTGLTALAADIITARSTVASLAFLLYDHVLTLDSEVSLVWNRQWSFGKALFLFNRYFAHFNLLLDVIVASSLSVRDKLCPGISWWQLASLTTSLISAEVILQARIYAVYNRNKKLLIIMAALCLAELSIQLLLFGLGTAPDKVQVVNDVEDCVIGFGHASYSFVWVPPLVFETFLCLLMLHKAWRVYKNSWRNPLLSILIRDSVLYFLTIFSVLFVNFIIWVLPGTQKANFRQFAVSWAVSMPSAVGSRLLLNMREQYFKEKIIPLTGDLSRGGIEMYRLETGHSTSLIEGSRNTTGSPSFLSTQ